MFRTISVNVKLLFSFEVKKLLRNIFFHQYYGKMKMARESSVARISDSESRGAMFESSSWRLFFGRALLACNAGFFPFRTVFTCSSHLYRGL